MLITDPRGEPVELDELDGDASLSVLADLKIQGRAVDREKLRVVHHWCVLHPATRESGVATFDPSHLPGVLYAQESLGGEGCPPVAAFTPEPLATTLGVSQHTIRQLLADTLDLHHRLPRCWKRVEALEVDVWKARRVAQLTHPLSQAAAAQVDAALAPVLHSCSVAAIERAVAAAVAAHHPELVAEREKKGKDAWDVTLAHDTASEFADTSYLDVTGDTLDLSAFYDRIGQIAADLADAGDEDPLGARKAKALGVLARQGIDGAEADLLSLIGTGDRQPAARPARTRKPKTHLYLHLSLLELLGLGADDDLVCGEAEKLGPVLLEVIRDWVGHSDSTITPVLDLDRSWSVDGHDVPATMREQVILRDRHCVFPYCHTDARSCDLDHIGPYVPLDEGGAPGQTNPENLAPLCRRHHRCKTSGRWRYRRRPDDGSYEWSGSYGRSYLVTPFGTLDLHTN
ncbi:HNH endonuclease signature motif containing protein [Nocardioides panaciterrulae]|uniref:HNH nuclease domain-containing protein n=1 Tax=Nocardioides panaciterrulae TaxID=661492 RepID=A0A7Y9E5F3_9ACTN|nr:HNH endonuclease signature motif containing protein [Nocardioides panaciterrulae]NYD41598.1 hypothetical protein [Nocardioides panaciterrulae]